MAALFQSVLDILHRCAEVHGNSNAQEVINLWNDDLASASSSEDFLGTTVFTLAAAALQGSSLEEKEDCIVGLELVLSLAAQTLDAEAQRRLQHTVLERTLRRLDTTGDALAEKASQELLVPSSDSGRTVASCTQPLRAVLALLLRCMGEDRVTARDLLELTRGDVALAVAVIAEALAAPKPAGLPAWPLRLCLMLQQLTSPDVFTWLVQSSQGEGFEDFNNTPMAEFRARQTVHCQAIALSYVQFDVVARALTAAEDNSQRQAVLAALMRALQSLVGSRDLIGPGRLLSRCLAYDFMRLGFRFLAPFGRKLIQESGTPEACKLIWLLCRTLCWLLIHAEADGSSFLSDSLKPIAAEWLMRALSKDDAKPKALLALLILAANCSHLSGNDQAVEQAGLALSRILADSSVQLEEELQRWVAFTAVGVQGFALLEIGIVQPDLQMGGDADLDSDDELYSLPVDWQLDFSGAAPPPPAPPAEGSACNECGEPSLEGSFGEGYFKTLWYCMSCWDQWQDAPAEMTAISPWPLESGKDAAESREQRGAAAVLLRVPGTLRCGISGIVLCDAEPVYVPNSSCTAYPVAFNRRCLEKWHRRSSGRCPLTGGPLDMKDVEAAPSVTEALLQWLQQAPD